MEVYAGFLEHTDHHLGRLIDALEDLEVLDDTLIYYIIGDNGASAEGTPNGCFNEMADAERPGRPRDPRVPDVEDRRLRRAEGLQPLRGRLGARDGHAVPVDQAGRVALGRHAQRHDRALAERHQGQGRGPQPVPSRDRRRADDPRSRRPAASDGRQQHPAGADRRRQHALRVQRRQGGRPARDAVLRDVLQPRHLPQGLDGGDPARRAVDRRLQARVRRGRLGAVRHQHRLDAGARSREGEPEEARRAAAPVPDRGGQVQRAAARRSDVRAVQPGPRRPPAADQGQDADPVRRHGAAHRELDRLDQEQVVLDHRRCRRAEVGRRGRHHRPGRQHQRLEPLREGRQAEVLLQLLRHRRDASSRRRSRSRPGHHQVRMEFKYDGGGLAKGGDVTLYVDGKQVGKGRVERTVPMAFSADETCDVGKEAGSPVSPDYGPTGNEFSGEVNWVQIDLEKDDHDHLISPEERFSVAMARQ